MTQPDAWTEQMRGRRLLDEGGRFIAGGLVNTLLSYLAFLMLLQLFSHQLAYAIAYAFGIVISYFINLRFVFRVPGSWRRALSFPLVYAVQYLLGAVLLELLTGLLGMPASVAMLGVIALTVPVSFLLSRYVLGGSNT